MTLTRAHNRDTVPLNELAGVFKLRRWCTSDHFLCELMSDQVPLYQKQERAGWMFSDCLALAFMAFVFIFALVCIMLERRNCNTSVFSSKNAKKNDKKRQKSDQKPLRRPSLYCSARTRRTQRRRKLQPAWKNNQVRLPNSFNGYNHPSLSYCCHIDQLIERLAEEN